MVAVTATASRSSSGPWRLTPHETIYLTPKLYQTRSGSATGYTWGRVEPTADDVLTARSRAAARGGVPRPGGAEKTSKAALEERLGPPDRDRFEAFRNATTPVVCGLTRISGRFTRPVGSDRHYRCIQHRVHRLRWFAAARSESRRRPASVPVTSGPRTTDARDRGRPGNALRFPVRVMKLSVSIGGLSGLTLGSPGLIWHGVSDTSLTSTSPVLMRERRAASAMRSVSHIGR